MNKTEHAISSFKGGLNCAQSVLLAYTDDYKIDSKTAAMISCGFGGGMGRLQETCGAVTGAFMVLGIHICSKFHDNKERKEKTYSLIQNFEKQFKTIHRSIRCSDLLQVDLRTQKGHDLFAENKLGENVCEKCITSAVQIVDQMIR